MADIWQLAQGEQHIMPMMATIYRLVESQEQIATLGLVNNVYEQGVLEELLETTKTPLPNESDSLHYLLKTPFRYPPLKYGSRFGAAFEPSLFYGSLNIFTALAETAYYRFVYMLGPEVPFAATISSEYSSFSVKVRSNNSIFLDKAPFTEYAPILTSPVSYVETQRLGTNMRQAGVEMFQYVSARDKQNQGKNIALFTPKAFQGSKPLKISHWLCQTSLDEVGFLGKDGQERVMFTQKEFWVEEKLPSPAT